VGIQDLDSETARDIGLPNAEGVYINRITIDGAAADAGLKSGDVVIGINNARVKSTSELQELVGRFRPGDQVNVEYWRGGRKARIRVTLKDVNNSTLVARVRGDELEGQLGFELRDLSRDEQQRLRLQGAIVTSVRRGSIVHQTNMQPGFVISSVNGDRVANSAEAIEAIKNAYNSLVLDGYYEGEPDLYSYRFKKEE
jgi:S1-C subfamily serine protease